MKRITLLSITALALAACDSSQEPKAPTKDAEPTAKAEKAEKAETKPETKPEADPKPEAVLANAEIGQPAPDFELADLEGNKQKLSDHKGKTVVLEWFNPECPFVKYAHGEGPLKTMAADKTGGGVVWLAINSGAPGKQGHGVDKNKKGAEDFGMSHPILLDEDGTVGKTYGAKTTPHLFIVDPEGKLVFRGGVDNAPMGEVKDGGELENYVATALEELAAGKPVGAADVRSYGCSVKYSS